MSWSGSASVPNWGGQDNASGSGGSGSVGDLYIVPDPPTIEQNPSIGLEGRNEVPLPTKYKDLEVKNINGNPDFDASNWYLYEAKGDVNAALLPLPPIIVPPLPYRRIYDLNNFRNINAGNLNAQLDGLNPLGTGQVNGFRGGFNLIDCETIDVSNDDETGTVSIYGASKLVGTNALYVEGGTTLTGGGIIHGTTIGAMNVGGIDTNRIDVVPAGIDITTVALPILITAGSVLTLTAGGATTVTAGGVLALAGGSYIQYNTDENRFINTSSGNDFTDILIGNIHPAFNGSANLRINGGGSGRGVELADTKSINLWTNSSIATWVNTTSYNIAQKVKFGSAWYNCLVINAYTQPNIPIPNWVTASNYIAGTIVFSAGLVYRCSSSISGSTTPPAPTSDPNWTNLGFTTNAITQIWAVFNPYVSTITGDELSVLRIGTIQGATGGAGVQLNDIKDLNLFTELPIADWVNSTNYATGTKVKYLDFYYNALFPNLNLQPTIPIPAFVDTNSYNVNNIVFETGEGAFRCITATAPPSAWVSSSVYNVGNRVAFGGLYYECAYRNLALQPATAIPVWVSGTSYVADQIVDYSGDTYFASGIPDPLVPPPSAEWILIFTGNNINNIWVPISINPPNANWQLIGSTNDITQVWPNYQPYQSSIDGDRFSSIDAGGMSSNFLTLAGKSYGDAILRFGSSTGSLSTIKQVNSTGQIVIDTAVGLKIDTTTSTDFSAGDVVNLKNLTLTSALNPTWSDIITYALNSVVERDGYNWRSEIAGNVGNIPQTLLAPWLLSSSYIIGNVRYDVGANNSYLCIANVSGSTTPPSGDPTNWSFFQVGSNAEDVWYSMGAVVESNIVGDRLSSIEIGTQDFVCEAGTYLTIGQDINQAGTIDATIGTGGSITLVGNDNATLGSLTGTAGIIGDSIYIQTIPTTGGNILVEANDQLTMGAINQVQLASTTGNVLISSLAQDITLNSFDDLTLAGGNNVILGSTTGNVNITSKSATNITATTGDIAINSDAGAVNMGSSAETSITAGDYINIQADENVDVIANTGTIAITGATDTTITATAGDLFLVAGNDINLTAGAGDKVIVNSTLDLTDKNVINADTITGQGALTLATTGATNLNLSPDTGGVIVANKNLSMGGNPITNCTSVGNNGVITIASTTNSIFISPSTSSGTGVVQITKNLDMATINAITNCIGVSSANALSFTANNGNVNLTATGSGNRIVLNSDATLGNRTLFNFTGTNVGGIFGLTTQPLNLVGQQATPQITIRGSLTMWQNATTQGSGNSISGVTTLNGRNLFSYGNFYNTATQTLGAINTATRIQMNTSANNNLITLDTTTNIGRLTFTNAGVYQVSWSAYLFHGAGGTAKSCIWIRLNGTDVAGSGKTENNDSQLNETNLASTSLVNVGAGGFIEFFWASNSVSVPLTSVSAVAPFPATPSFACSIQIVG